MPAGPQDIRIDPREQVLALLEQMRAAVGNGAELNQLSDQMEVLVRSYLTPEVSEPLPGVHFTKLEARIFARLLKSAGHSVTKEQLMDALYFDKQNEAQPKIIDVLMCRLRAKIQASAYRVATVWGSGYRLEVVA